jgi:molybdopterin converting factor small subunit
MTPCTVELFGVARMIARAAEVPLVLPPAATLSDLLAALAAEVPPLVGRVISADRRSLSAGYICNINGLEFVREESTPVRRGDRIVLLSADAGG